MVMKQSNIEVNMLFKNHIKLAELKEGPIDVTSSQAGYFLSSTNSQDAHYDFVDHHVKHKIMHI